MSKHPPAQQQQFCSQQLLMTNMQLHQLLHCCPSAMKLHSSATSQLSKARHLQAAAHQSCMSAFIIISPRMHGMLHEQPAGIQHTQRSKTCCDMHAASATADTSG
jgi:hypothetical protein